MVHIHPDRSIQEDFDSVIINTTHSVKSCGDCIAVALNVYNYSLLTFIFAFSSKGRIIGCHVWRNGIFPLELAGSESQASELESSLLFFSAFPQILHGTEFHVSPTFHQLGWLNFAPSGLDIHPAVPSQRFATSGYESVERCIWRMRRHDMRPSRVFP